MEEALEKIYLEKLDEMLIAYLAKVRDTSLEEAMELYYRSRLASLIADNREGVQYLDYKTLVQMLLEYEPELFEMGQTDPTPLSR